MKKLHKIQVDFSKRIAKINNTEFKIFTDLKGLKIFTNKGVVFLNPHNAEVI